MPLPLTRLLQNEHHLFEILRHTMTLHGVNEPLFGALPDLLAPNFRQLIPLSLLFRKRIEHTRLLIELDPIPEL